MEKIVVYFSLEGNTEYVAKTIAQKTGSALLKIEPLKPYPKEGVLKYFHGGRHASTNFLPEIKPYEFDASKYDMIIFATPVWAANYAPPLRTFIEQNRNSFNGKSFALFTGYRGGGVDKAAEKMAKSLNIKKFEEHLILVDALAKKSEEKDAAISEFCKILMQEK